MTNNNLQKLELTWIGKGDEPKLEPRILIENPDYSWDNNSKRYEPDFIVETADTIYMIETKAANEISNDDVLAKKAAAEKYCKYATEYTTVNGGKSWKYLLIPYNEVSRTVGLDYLILLIK